MRRFYRREPPEFPGYFARGRIPRRVFYLMMALVILLLILGLVGRLPAARSRGLGQNDVAGTVSSAGALARRAVPGAATLVLR